MDGQTDMSMTKLIVAFLNFAKEPKNGRSCFVDINRRAEDASAVLQKKLIKTLSS
jgi:hypothetical protein